jgi:hypothetical protein
MSATGWRVWRAFEDEPERDDRELWRSLAESCRTPEGRIDGVEFDRWLNLILNCNRRGLA